MQECSIRNWRHTDVTMYVLLWSAVTLLFFSRASLLTWHFHECIPLEILQTSDNGKLCFITLWLRQQVRWHHHHTAVCFKKWQKSHWKEFFEKQPRYWRKRSTFMWTSKMRLICNLPTLWLLRSRHDQRHHWQLQTIKDDCCKIELGFCWNTPPSPTSI